MMAKKAHCLLNLCHITLFLEIESKSLTTNPAITKLSVNAQPLFLEEYDFSFLKNLCFVFETSQASQTFHIKRRKDFSFS